MVGFRNRRYTRTPYELRRSLRRVRSIPDISETIIIHSDSEEEENRINSEIHRLKSRMDDLDEEKRRLFTFLSKKYQERERIRVARQIRINNIRLRREFENRLLPNIESVARNRQSVIHGARTLFDDINDHPTDLPPSYESLFNHHHSRDTFSTSTPSNNDNHRHENLNNNNNNSNNNNSNNNNSNDSDSSDTDLPDIDSIFNNL